MSEKNGFRPALLLSFSQIGARMRPLLRSEMTIKSSTAENNKLA